ncbi:hypothetical protein [Actomonas aquatica]|uniref:DUF4034 domain-containing protein n=1 Tax=Actomonas aquatica TaxID=2866162 RepID=A0ABZ1C2Y8_9BACT|nr:hypothetical protein [Opitutus sp. WL0086]WRQ85960.1 hypothetical protein K1X11_014195 [Opitutus sp. WL0086]
MALTLAFVARGEAPTPAGFKAALAETLKPANRVVVREMDFDSADGSMPVLFDKTDRAAIETLVAHFEPTGDGGHCLCIGTTLVEFYREEEFVMGFTEHHLFRLRSESAPWGGDLELAGEAEASLWAGFAEIGFPYFVERRDREKLEEAVRDAHWAEFLAVFPEPVRTLVPRGISIEERVGRDFGERLYEAMGDSVESVHTLWRALHWQATEGHLSAWAYSRQPFRAIGEALEGVSPAVLEAAVDGLRSDDHESPLRLGAAVHLLTLSGHEGALGEAMGDALWQELVRDLWRDIEARDAEDAATVIEACLNTGEEKLAGIMLEWLREQNAPAPPIEEEVRNPREVRFPYPGVLVRVALRLASWQRTEALPVIAHLCEVWPAGPDKLALEVARAQLDPARVADLGEAHLLCEFEDVSAATHKLLLGEGREFPLELLVKLAAERAESGVVEIEFVPFESPKAWARARLAEQGLKALPIQREHRGIVAASEEQALERLQAGDFENARRLYQTLITDPEKPLMGVWASAGTGRVEEAYASVSVLVDGGNLSRIDGVVTDEAVLARGLLFFAWGQFEEAAADFAAALRLGSRDDEWCYALQHLAMQLAEKPDRSLLPQWQRYQGFPDKNGEPFVSQSDATLLYLRGELDAAAMLEYAHGRASEVKDWNRRDLSRAHWVIATQARVAGDEQTELAHLRQVLALADYTDGAYVLARLRERELRWASDPL